MTKTVKIVRTFGVYPELLTFAPPYFILQNVHRARYFYGLLVYESTKKIT